MIDIALCIAVDHDPWLVLLAVFICCVGAFAVAQMFTGQDSRVQRPQQSYEITKKIDASQEPAQGLDLVIAGRLAPLSDERPIHCAFAQGAPACLIGAKFDKVSIENPVDGSVVGEWSQW